MKIAATQKMLRLVKLLEVKVPGAPLFFFASTLAIGLAVESVPDDASVTLAPVAAVGPATEVTFWKRM